ncbi:methyltransferase [Galactobacter sp.]|uniref:class I SAM-dependent methyltransferase n=1 Tax=Galactobacter sp. TaxID=2676125 RepID=UPI0025C66F88|nr:methyltransferase [Galactobacter sp.]
MGAMTQDKRTALDLTRLSRFPDVEDPTLLPYDATDELLVAEALTRIVEQELTGTDIVVVGERHGAITLSLVAAGLTGLRVVQDRLVHERALDANAERIGIDPTVYVHAPAAAETFTGARLILWQLPRAVDSVTRMVSLMGVVDDDAVLVAGGRVKHLSRGMNAPLEAGFGSVTPQLAKRKSRLLVVDRNAELHLEPVVPSRKDVRVAGRDLTLIGIGEAFGGAALDPGTRLMLESLSDVDIRFGSDPTIVDLGCGNGTVAAWAAQRWPQAKVIATDDSADAVASAAATLEATLGNGPSSAVGHGVARVQVIRADAGDAIPDASADLVLLNPPFHQGGTVHTGIGVKLIEAAARMMKHGGTLVTVFNTPVGHRPRLQRIVGPTEQLGRDRTFTVTLSTRR